MSTDYPTTPPVGHDTSGASTPGGDAREQAARVGHEASESTKRVASTAADEAKDVAREAKSQARELFDEAKAELSDQASSQQHRAASNLRTMSEELRRMAERSEDDGMASQLVSTTASKVGSVAGWLEQREPGDILDEVRDFARRRPGVFIGIAALAGVAVGRLTRGVMSSGGSSGSSGARTLEHPRPSTTSASMPDAALGTAYTGGATGSTTGSTTGSSTGGTSTGAAGGPSMPRETGDTLGGTRP